jgi:uncharacterized RDD family membrane protein YckC
MEESKKFKIPIKRLLAYLIDVIILAIPLTLIAYLSLGNIWTRIITIVSYWLYFAFMESSNKQGSLGKIILKIKVVNEEGNAISFGKATIRHIGKILSGLALLIGFIMVFFTKKQQCLHDIIAKTLVINKNDNIVSDNVQQEISNHQGTQNGGEIELNKKSVNIIVSLVFLGLLALLFSMILGFFAADINKEYVQFTWVLKVFSLVSIVLAPIAILHEDKNGKSNDDLTKTLGILLIIAGFVLTLFALYNLTYFDRFKRDYYLLFPFVSTASFFVMGILIFTTVSRNKKKLHFTPLQTEETPIVNNNEYVSEDNKQQEAAIQQDSNVKLKLTTKPIIILVLLFCLGIGSIISISNANKANNSAKYHSARTSTTAAIKSYAGIYNIQKFSEAEVTMHKYQKIIYTKKKSTYTMAAVILIISFIISLVYFIRLIKAKE